MTFQIDNQYININALNYKFKYVQCHEVQEVMQHDNINLINTLNIFKIIS
jgi:hypothetical protein